MDVDLPKWKRPRFTVGTLVALTAVFLSLALVLAFSAIRVGQGIERDSRTQDRTEIAGLRAAQAQSAEITSCIRLFAVERDEARDARDTALADAIVTAVGGGDPAADVDVYEAANAAFKVAATAYGDYVKNPVLPCTFAG